MTTTTTAAWNPAITQMIRQALIYTGAFDESQTIPNAAYQSGLFAANALAKEWQGIGLHVWTEEEAILFLEPGRERYLIGGTTTTANTSAADDWSITELAANGYTAGTSITVDDTDGFEDGFNIGIVLDDNTTFWTTIDGAPVGSVITLADAMPSDAGSGNAVFAYETRILRPLKVPDGRLLQFANMNETWMTVLSRQEYMDLPNKQSTGIPTQFFYSPQLVSGLFYVWPVPTNSNYAIRFTWYRPIFDFDSPANTMDFPQEWANALTWNLAKELAPSYGVSDSMWARITKMAEEKLDAVSRYDRESEPIQFGMDWQTR